MTCETDGKKSLGGCMPVIALITTLAILLAVTVNKNGEREVHTHRAALRELTQRGLLFTITTRAFEVTKNTGLSGQFHKSTTGTNSGGTADATRENTPTGVKVGTWKGKHISSTGNSNALGLHNITINVRPDIDGTVYTSTYCPDEELPLGCECSKANEGNLEINSLDDTLLPSCDCAYGGLDVTKTKILQIAMTCDKGSVRLPVRVQASDAMGHVVKSIGNHVKDALEQYGKAVEGQTFFRGIKCLFEKAKGMLSSTNTAVEAATKEIQAGEAVEADAEAIEEMQTGVNDGVETAATEGAEAGAAEGAEAAGAEGAEAAGAEGAEAVGAEGAEAAAAEGAEAVTAEGAEAAGEVVEGLLDDVLELL